MPALITPFDDDGNIIVEAHHHNLRLQTSRGVTGFLLAGSTGEGPYLEPGERALLVRETRNELGDEPFVLCGVAAQSVRQAIAQVEEIASSEADAALVMTPTGLARGNHDAVMRFFDSVAEAAPIPIFLYSVPAVTGYELPVDCAARLSQHPNVVAMKDSGGRPIHIKELVQSTPDDFVVYAGSSSTLAQAMAAGAVGAITASGNYLPELISKLVVTSRSSVSATEPMQVALTEVTREVEAFGVVGTKAAAATVGLRTGGPRKPLQAVQRAEQARLAQVVAAARSASDSLVTN
jgi:dihydrodipicolinate synthase/N-acetylneuraminate lyase